MILIGDCRETLRTLSPASVQCVVTSPPYFALRDYGSHPLDWPAVSYTTIGGHVEVAPASCSLGLERHPNYFIGHMLLVFDEIHRVMKDDGTAWVNIGDSYASTGGQSPRSGEAFAGRARQKDIICLSNRYSGVGAKSKDMLGIPWMLAFALRARGWYLRQDIIWHKPNPIPESATDRCTKAHEYLFLLSKSPRYYFDQDAIKEQASKETHARVAKNENKGVAGWAVGQGNHTVTEHAAGDRQDTHAAAIKEVMRHRDATRRNPNNGVGFGHGFDKDPKPRVTERIDAGASARMGRAPGWRDGVSPKAAAGEHGNRSNASFAAAVSQEVVSHRNKRSVWTIPTQPFSQAHFATFPEELVKPCILAGSRPGDTVLDPFLGSGTVGQVAIELGRAWIGCELEPKYIPIAEARTGNAHPGFSFTAEKL